MKRAYTGGLTELEHTFLLFFLLLTVITIAGINYVSSLFFPPIKPEPRLELYLDGSKSLYTENPLIIELRDRDYYSKTIWVYNPLGVTEKIIASYELYPSNSSAIVNIQPNNFELNSGELKEVFIEIKAIENSKPLEVTIKFKGVLE